MVPLLAVSAIATLLYAQDQVEHPFIDPKDIKSATCLACHPEKKDGKFVHPAVLAGCENCHHAASRDSTTAISLVATGGDLCAKCHEPKKDPVLHGPYKAGQCLVCHDPHAGAFKAQLRADVNTLCLSCHGLGQSNVKVNADANLVLLLGSQNLSLDEYRQAPKLALDPSGTSGHPLPGHPLIGKDRRGKEMSCLSCHDPHSSVLPKLMLHGLKSGLDLCGQCHSRTGKR